MAWAVIFYATAEGSVPGADFLDGCPAKIRGTILDANASSVLMTAAATEMGR
jgi:hypothetical protein